MFMPLPLPVYNHHHQMSSSNDIVGQSVYYPPIKRSSDSDDQTLTSCQFDESKPRIKRQQIFSSSPITQSKMQSQQQQQSTAGATTDASTLLSNRLCSVCGDLSTGIHFGGNSCESCKAFFRRSVQCHRFQNYKCSCEERCPVNIVTRKVCQFCRYTKCTTIGMKPKWVLSDQEREEKYGSRRKRFREGNVTAEEDPDIYKYLTKEEKLLIEDIAHAFYQSRATYPLQFPTQLKPDESVPVSTESASSTNVPPPKPANPAANLLTIPIQRLVLFARMLKDFDLFTEDDKVKLLKGSAMETIVCSSNTLFDPKTQRFSNYISRDQRALMDNQTMVFDPLLKQLWGVELFERTRSYLVSMCNLHTDEVSTILLTPIILFTPDRSNVQDMQLVHRLQIKYANLLRKYMNWRYGIEQTDQIYPKLLLKLVDIRTLGVQHSEIIQRGMATSNVNPLVEEVSVRHPTINSDVAKNLSKQRESMSSSSSPDNEVMELDKSLSVETESTNGSDEDENSKQTFISTGPDDDLEDLDETNPKNIWRKRRKLSNNQISTFSSPQSKPSQQPTTIATKSEPIPGHYHSASGVSPQNKHESIMQPSILPRPVALDTYDGSNTMHVRPHDHQVPTLHHGDLMTMTHSPHSLRHQARHLPLKKQSLAATVDALHQQHNIQQLYRSHSSSTGDLYYSSTTSTPTDLTPYDYTSRAVNPTHPMRNTAVLSSPSQHPYPIGHLTPDVRHHYAQMSTSNQHHRHYHQQQQQNEQHLRLLSLATNQGQSPSSLLSSTTHLPIPSHVQPLEPLDEAEKQLLDAIHAHPQKRDLVLNLLRQMNASPHLTTTSLPVNHSPHQNDVYHSRHRYSADSTASSSSLNYTTYRSHSTSEQQQQQQQQQNDQS